MNTKIRRNAVVGAILVLLVCIVIYCIFFRSPAADVRLVCAANEVEALAASNGMAERTDKLDLRIKIKDAVILLRNILGKEGVKYHYCGLQEGFHYVQMADSFGQTGFLIDAATGRFQAAGKSVIFAPDGKSYFVSNPSDGGEWFIFGRDGRSLWDGLSYIEGQDEPYMSVVHQIEFRNPHWDTNGVLEASAICVHNAKIQWPVRLVHKKKGMGFSPIRDCINGSVYSPDTAEDATESDHIDPEIQKIASSPNQNVWRPGRHEIMVHTKTGVIRLHDGRPYDESLSGLHYLYEDYLGGYYLLGKQEEMSFDGVLINAETGHILPSGQEVKFSPHMRFYLNWSAVDGLDGSVVKLKSINGKTIWDGYDFIEKEGTTEYGYMLYDIRFDGNENVIAQASCPDDIDQKWPVRLMKTGKAMTWGPLKKCSEKENVNGHREEQSSPAAEISAPQSSPASREAEN